MKTKVRAGAGGGGAVSVFSFFSASDFFSGLVFLSAFPSGIAVYVPPKENK